MKQPNIKVISRKSNLAVIQAKEALQEFSHKISYELISIDSYGDKHKEISLMSEINNNFFTKELDQAILENKADIAIHSAKDIPFPLPQNLEVLALLKAEDKTDSLVSTHNLKLSDLPKNAKIGTSSKNRKEQVLKLRPDLKIVSIRGTIEERLNLLNTGNIDALIVATCALKRLSLTNLITEILPFNTHPLQGNLAIVSKSNRPDLKTLFSKKDIRNKYGKAYLVGYGPGDPELMTIKADKILSNCDVILYDDLINAEHIQKYPAKKVYVGKRKGKQKNSQTEINELLYKSAISGKSTVRLKGGDPLIFSRGGEELEYLEEKLVTVDIVPGISAFQAAAASAKIPLTKREFSSRLSIHSGHHSIDNPNHEQETIIYYMAASKLQEIKDKLIKQGKDKNTPCALIRNTGSADEEIHITSLANIGERELPSPVLIIIGDVVSYFQKQPKLLFTGLTPTTLLSSSKVIHYPLIEIEALETKVTTKQPEAIVFTSKTAVNIFCQNNKISNKTKIICIGIQTNKKLEEFGYKSDFIPKKPDSDAIVKLINKLNFSKIIYPCSNLSDNQLHHLPNIEKIVIYKTKFKNQPKLPLSEFTEILFSSPSTVESFFTIYDNIPAHIIISVYGKHTASKLAEKGYKQNVQTIPI
jgi:uroporphyrinogen III methyltransferase / synthase